MPPTVLLTVSRIALLALAYFVLARLGLLLAIPPGYATAIWVPSGLAIAGLLLWGYPVVLGVFLGSFSVNSVISGAFSASAPSAFILPACIGLGAALQAVCGKWLIERFCSPPWTFINLRQPLMLIALGGPVACILSASMGSGSLWAFGVLESEAVFDSWSTWWLGDALGVIVFSPLLLLWQEKHEFASLNRKLKISIPLLLVFAAVCYLYVDGKQEVETQIREELEEKAFFTNAYLQEQIGQKRTLVNATIGLFNASNKVTKDEFFTFFEALQENLPGLQALSWAPRVRREDIPAFLAEVKKEGYDDFSLRELSSGELVPITSREVYQPVLHVTPQEAHKRAQGFDLLSETTRKTAVDNALRTGKLAAAGPLVLVQTKDSTERAYLLIQPVGGDNNQDVVSAVLRLDSLLEPFDRLGRGNHFGFELTEVRSGQVLVHSNSGSGSDFHNRSNMPFFDQTWRLDLWMPDAAVAQAMNERLWPILFGGFCIIGSLALLIITSTGAQASAAAMIEQKTQELEQERSFLETLIDHLPLILYVKDAKTRQYIRSNHAAQRVLGDDSIDLINHTQEELFAEGMGHSSQEADDEVVYGKKIHVETTRFVHKNDVYWFESRKIPIIDRASGTVSYILGLAEDITAHRNAERSLEDSRQRISRILENVGEGIYGINANGQLTFVNPACVQFLGFDEQEMLGQDAHALFHHHYKNGEHFAKDKCSIHQTLLSGKSHRVDDEVFWKKDGSCVPVEYVCTPIIEGNKVIGAVVVFSDISKRLVLERLQLEQTRRIEQINEELEEFSYVASHDIQEPLRTLNCFCDFLAEDLGEDLPERAATDLEYIKEASQRMSVLINDMLEYSRAGRSELELEPVSLDECVKQVNDSLQLLIREQNATLTIGTLPAVMGDSNSLVRIFQNLIQNAIKFCKDRPPLVTVQEVENDGAFTTVVVEDNGIGIDERFIEQIFGAFRRLNNAEEYSGSGIGLAVVKKLVDRHGGKIWVESTPGEGSRFFVSLPLRTDAK